MTYEGVTFVSAPLTAGLISENLATGWWAQDVLSQAIANTDGQQTGFSLQGGQFPVDETFGEGKAFSRIKTWVLSQQPTVKIVIGGGETSNIESDFKEQTSTSIDLFGFIDIGSVNQSYEVQSVDSSSVSGSVVITLGAPDVTSGTTDLADSRAFVIGGVASYPPTAT
jgi:hypothetical protein